MDFRATGNEPPWILEITGDRLDLFLGYDRRHRRLRAAPETRHDPPRTTYTARDDAGTVRITLTPRPCRDTMQGDAFETTVEIRLDGKTLHGCGRALH